MAVDTSRRPSRAFTGGFAGGFAGLIVASALVAICRGSSPCWVRGRVRDRGGRALGIVGSGLAGLSTLFVKGKP